MDKKYIQGLSMVKSSRYRLNILSAIGDEIITPSEIAKKTKLRLNHISMFLKEMKKNDLVQCLNEDSKKGRLYQLTTLGKKIIKDCEK